MAPASTSMMPPGLVNMLKEDEILDLIRKNTEELFSLLEKHKLHNLKNYYLTYQNIINKKLANSHETVTSQTGLTPESWAFLNDYQ